MRIRNKHNKLRCATRTPSGGYSAQKKTGGGTYYLGTHVSPRRANIAVRIFEYWISEGYQPYSIPRRIEKPLADSGSIGMQPTGARGAPYKMVEATNIKTGERFVFYGLGHAAREGFVASAVSRCCNQKTIDGRPKKHAGYHWRYI